MSKATGASLSDSQAVLRKSLPSVSPAAIDVELDDKKTLKKRSKCAVVLKTLEPWVSTVVYTSLALYVRLHLIDRSPKVVWDEAHFGKFGSYYVKHEFYHDVHPPLGKMLIGLSEWIAGYDGADDFKFESGKAYPEGLDFKTMRVFNALFSAAVTPVAYWAARWMDLQLITVHLITLMVTLESSFVTLGKFILLDSILLFFTATTFLTMVKLYQLKKKEREFTKEWYTWMVLTGLSIGCVCSVKWVGLFVTVLVGLFVIQDLVEKFFEQDLKWEKYAKHWLVRIITLICIPLSVYLICFKIHFALLYKSGTGDASTSSLFQVNLEGTKIKNSPRDIVYGSEVTIRSHGGSPNLLHSHVQIYPEGSNQQQITAYGHSDGNNNWLFKFSRRDGRNLDHVKDLIPVKDGGFVRLGHKYTGVNLHSHEISAHVTKQHREVAGYGNEEVGDTKDDWILEIVSQARSSNASYANEDKKIVHPLSTTFRLKHADLGCYLATTGQSYPSWGFKQSEVVCKESWSSMDKSTWWNVEDHMNQKMEIDEYYTPPKSDFWSDFVIINFAMASTNNALVPDQDKYDALASKWWQWPTLYLGLRMCGWGYTDIRYFLIGNVFNTWGSSIALVALIFLIAVYIVKFQRQSLDWTYSHFWYFLIQAAYPFLGWILHFLPFVIMGRVTYVHHYVPALFFAIYVLGFMIEFTVGKTRAYIKYPVYLVCLGALIFTFWYYRAFHEGMTGNHKDFKSLNLLPTWRAGMM
jgi:dolichyl-phosphate-mannose-protein mannosyltransferase